MNGTLNMTKIGELLRRGDIMELMLALLIAMSVGLTAVIVPISLIAILKANPSNGKV